ncbi:MAG: anaerobic ribonucleoside triphosphate reductase [Clostridia bacterium]|nr:anaerobic ribonucleoside triphosphate reductase [Clostridia bacterium]
MPEQIRKRDGRLVEYNEGKIAKAIERAFRAVNSAKGEAEAARLAEKVTREVDRDESIAMPTVEFVQDKVEQVLIDGGYVKTAKAYILYRAERSRVREANTRLMGILQDITFKAAAESDVKRENANIDGDTAMGTMLKYGSESAKQFNDMYVLNPEHARAHREGDIHIHDLDFLTLTTTCTQIDLTELFRGGFSTGHGVVREPQDIGSYSSLACIAIQSNQNDQHGGQAIASFDYDMAPGVAKTYVKEFRRALGAGLDLLLGRSAADDEAKALLRQIERETGEKPTLKPTEAFNAELKACLMDMADEATCERIIRYAEERGYAETDRRTFQAMESFIHNLNTMHSRAGAQTPFSSINYGMDTSPEGRMVMRNLLLTTEKGLGRGETPIFPIQIFRVKEGVSYNPGDPNYDLFRLAMRVSAKRLFPNFSFVDAPFNLQYYQPGRRETEIAYMGCRTRVIGNVADPERQVCNRRGNLSFTSINLPRIAIEAKGDIEKFYQLLDERLALVVCQLDERFEIQARKKVRNYPFLMGEGVWMDSETLGPDEEVRRVLRHGTLSIGFIGLAETLVALIGEHHGQTERAQKLGLEIVTHMRKYVDDLSKERQMNYTLLATPAEGLSGRFVKMDRERFGAIPGITDREYYTNSFHVPVYHKISAFEKIQKEGPYHALTNAGHISYIEMDGDPSRNLDAFEAVVRAMHDAGIGYGSINHPVDRDPVCGYNGIINDVCPQCGRTEYEVHFERIRRITGYLVGTMDRWGNAKRAEEHDRVKHES